MTDSSVICRFMGWILDAGRCPTCGWPFAETSALGCVPGNCAQRPAPATPVSALPTLTFERLREVEARLTKDQRLDYWLELARGGPPEDGYWRVVHASAETKIKSLAAVLRPLVEGKEQTNA